MLSNPPFSVNLLLTQRLQAKRQRQMHRSGILLIRKTWVPPATPSSSGGEPVKKYGQLVLISAFFSFNDFNTYQNAVTVTDAVFVGLTQDNNVNKATFAAAIKAISLYSSGSASSAQWIFNHSSITKSFTSSMFHLIIARYAYKMAQNRTR